MPKLYGSDDVTTTLDNSMPKKRFLANFEVVAETDLKIGALPVILSTLNFQGLFLSKLNLKSGKMG